MYLKCNAENCTYVSEDYSDIGQLIIKFESEGGQAKLNAAEKKWEFTCPNGHPDHVIELKQDS